jgi:predicted transcriptional regulator of viral defense system
MPNRLVRNSGRLAEYVERLQTSGRYTFTRPEVRRGAKASAEALKKSLQRLASRGRIAVPRRGFYIVVPTEYRGVGAPPPPWFIDDLMRFLQCPYYVGLLSAAAVHGAGHQQPQEFQVVVGRQLRPVEVGRGHIRFFVNRRLHRSAVTDVKTETGSMRVSTPEATALDLVRYPESVGHLGDVAAVLADLAEAMKPSRLAAEARAMGEMASTQRLGYLLDRVGAASLAEPLARLVRRQRPWIVALRPDRPAQGRARNTRWNVLVNEDVDVEP